jgi:hypothetical protein
MVTPYFGRLAAWDRGETTVRPRTRSRFEPVLDDRHVVGSERSLPAHDSRLSWAEALLEAPDSGASEETPHAEPLRSTHQAWRGGESRPVIGPLSSATSASMEAEQGESGAENLTAASGSYPQPSPSSAVEASRRQREPSSSSTGELLSGIRRRDLLAASALAQPAVPQHLSPPPTRSATNGPTHEPRRPDGAAQADEEPEGSDWLPPTNRRDEGERLPGRPGMARRSGKAGSQPPSSVDGGADSALAADYMLPLRAATGPLQRREEQVGDSSRRTDGDARRGPGVAPESAETAITVSIDRVVVRVQAPLRADPAPATGRPDRVRPTSLDDYLDARTTRRLR